MHWNLSEDIFFQETELILNNITQLVRRKKKLVVLGSQIKKTEGQSGALSQLITEGATSYWHNVIACLTVFKQYKSSI